MSSEEERKWLKFFKSRLEQIAPLPSIERAKTPEERQLIQEIADRLMAFAETYGARRFPVGPDQLRFIEKAALSADMQERLDRLPEYGLYYPEHQTIVIFVDANTLKTAHTVSHELLHLWSFASMTKQGDVVRLRRTGLEIFLRGDDGDVFFHLLDEAVIEELTRRFDEDVLTRIDAFCENVALRRDLRSRYPEKASEIASILRGTRADGTQESIPVYFGYAKSRQRLSALIDDIYARGGDECRSREEVFRRFTDAVFRGALLPLARLIEQTTLVPIRV